MRHLLNNENASSDMLTPIEILTRITLGMVSARISLEHANVPHSGQYMRLRAAGGWV